VISILVLVGLAVVWAIVIFPDVVRWISNNRRGDTIRTFNSQLSSLGRSNAVRDNNVIDLRDRMVSPVDPGNARRAPKRVVQPVGSALRTGAVGDRTQRTPAPHAAARSAQPRPVSPAVRKRRQEVLVALGAACLLTLLATIAFGPVFLYLHLLADALLVGYLVALQRTITGGAMGPRHARHGSLAPLSGPVRSDDLVVRPQVVEPHRIAN
jgi:hypothetical protein